MFSSEVENDEYYTKNGSCATDTFSICDWIPEILFRTEKITQNYWFVPRKIRRY